MMSDKTIKKLPLGGIQGVFPLGGVGVLMGVFVGCYILLLLIACGLLMSYDKAELHLMLNAHHTAWQDLFFKYYTVLAEWPLYIVALIPLCFHKWRWTLYYAITEGSGALVIRLLKITFHSPRPVAYFEDIHNASLPLVEGVRMHHSNSFPSGHSSTFFIFFTFAALLLCNYWRTLPTSTLKGRNVVLQQMALLGLLLCAAVGCYSRIYLSQHFLSDVTVGSLVGVIMPCVMFMFFGTKIIGTIK